MLQYIIKAYRYKTAREKEESADDRVTKDAICKVETYYMNATKEQPKAGRRVVKVQFGRSQWYHMPARDLAAVLRDLDFEVTDKR